MKINTMILCSIMLSLSTVICTDAWHIRCRDKDVCQKEDDLKTKYRKKRADINHNKEIAELEFKKNMETLRDKKVKLNLDYRAGNLNRHDYEKHLADLEAEIDTLKNAYNKKMLDFKHEEKIAEIDYNKEKRALKQKR